MNDHRAQYETSKRAAYDALQNLTMRELYEFTQALEAERSRQSLQTVTPAVVTAVVVNEIVRRTASPSLPDIRETPPARLHDPNAIATEWRDKSGYNRHLSERKLAAESDNDGRVSIGIS